MRLGTMEILLILGIALVVFGGGKLSGLGKALGTSVREFKEELGTPEGQAAIEGGDNHAGTAPGK